MTMACHGVGPGCTAIGADDACGGMWTAWAGAAVTGSPSVGVIVASPGTVRRRWWRPVCGAQVVVGSVIEWRWMAWSPGVISFHPSVPLWTAHSRGRSRNPLRSGVVRCCGGSIIHHFIHATGIRCFCIATATRAFSALLLFEAITLPPH